MSLRKATAATRTSRTRTVTGSYVHQTPPSNQQTTLVAARTSQAASGSTRSTVRGWGTQGKRIRRPASTTTSSATPRKHSGTSSTPSRPSSTRTATTRTRATTQSTRSQLPQSCRWPARQVPHPPRRPPTPPGYRVVTRREHQECRAATRPALRHLRRSQAAQPDGRTN